MVFDDLLWQISNFCTHLVNKKRRRKVARWVCPKEQPLVPTWRPTLPSLIPCDGWKRKLGRNSVSTHVGSDGETSTWAQGASTGLSPHTYYSYPDSPNGGLSPPRQLFWSVANTCFYHFMLGGSCAAIARVLSCTERFWRWKEKEKDTITNLTKNLKTEKSVEGSSFFGFV